MLAALPNIFFGPLVLVGFVLLARGVRAGVLCNRPQGHSLALWLSRLAYVATLILSVLITIVLPGLTAALWGRAATA